MDRLAMLKKMAAQKPGEPFVQYGLAMELKKQGEQAEARACFEGLIGAHADYLPAYLMAGNLLAEMGDAAAARATYEQGIAQAKAASDEHTQGELEAALGDLS